MRNCLLNFVLCLPLAGCIATQSDVVSVQSNVVGLQSEMVKLQNQLTEMQKNQADLSVQMEDLNTNIKTLNLNIDDTNERFVIFGQKLEDTNVDFTNKLSMLSEKVTKKIEETKPTPTQIYGAAYTDYTMKNYDLAISGFQEYIQQYPNGTLAPNAQFWIGACYYDNGNYSEAMEGFDKLITSYPKNEKIPSAKLKKAHALLKLNNKSKAITVFEDISKSYPKTNEARQASSYLSTLNKPQ